MPSRPHSFPCRTCSSTGSSWRSTTRASSARRSSAFGSSSRARASRPPSSARRSPWPSCGRCTRRSGGCSSTQRTSGAASWARKTGSSPPARQRAPAPAAAGRPSSIAPGGLGSTGHPSTGSTRGRERMRAVIHDRYGPPEVLRVDEVEPPVPADDEVLVRVHASTIRRGDAIGVRHVDYRFSRAMTGIRRPRDTRFGSDFAGRVEAVGAAVTELAVGDDVFGVKAGSNAEYVAVRESGVMAPKPAALTYEEAAAVPDGSLLALSCLRPAYPLQGKSVLVYGAAGSVGTAAVQL